MSVPQHSHLPSQPSSFDPVPLGLPSVTSESSADRLEQALRLWLRWNDAYEHLTAEMFKVAHDQPRVEALAEEIDRRRQRAIAASRVALR